jgi:hypothetical protein
MILSLSKRLKGLVISLLMVLLASSSIGQEKRAGRPIDFSDPKSPDVVTNVNKLNKKSVFKELEEDLTKSFQRSLSSHSSLDGVMVPPPQTMSGPRIQHKKVKELLERKRNWIFNTPEDLSSAPTLEEMLHLPDYAIDPEKKKSRSSIERYYERLSKKSSIGPRERTENSEMEPERDGEDVGLFGINKFEVSEKLDEAKQDNIAAQEQNKADSTLRQLFEVKPNATFSPFDSQASPIGDMFRLGTVTPSPQQVEASKVYLKQYEALLGKNPLPNAGIDLQNPALEVKNPFDGVANAQPVPSTFGNVQTIAQPNVFSTFDTKPGILGSALAPMGISPGALPDLGPKVNPWNSPVSLPKTETPRLLTPSGRRRSVCDRSEFKV